MDTIENIQNAILNQVEGAVVVPWNNGGIQVTVQDKMDCAIILEIVADLMYNYDCEDIQVTTNQARYEVYIDICDREDDDEEDEHWKPDGEGELQVGDIICYRMGLVRVLGMDDEHISITDPYGVEQVIDWDDVHQYNPNIKKPCFDENGEEHCSRGEVDDD